MQATFPPIPLSSSFSAPRVRRENLRASAARRVLVASPCEYSSCCTASSAPPVLPPSVPPPVCSRTRPGNALHLPHSRVQPVPPPLRPAGTGAWCGCGRTRPAPPASLPPRRRLRRSASRSAAAQASTAAASKRVTPLPRHLPQLAAHPCCQPLVSLSQPPPPSAPHAVHDPRPSRGAETVSRVPVQGMGICWSSSSHGCCGFLFFFWCEKWMEIKNYIFLFKKYL